MDYVQKLQETILPDLEKGRKDWDAPHTQAVVDYMQQIIDHNPQLNLDQDVLLIAAYAHDWGYSKVGITGQAIGWRGVGAVKKAHMEIGAQLLTDLLQDSAFSFLTNAQKQRAVHLVAVHDTLDAIHDTDEHILVEADTLGALDFTKVTPTYNQEDSARYLASTDKKRWPLYITDYGKKKYHELYAKYQEYYRGRS